MKPVRVLVVDDSAVIRNFLRETLARDTDLVVVGAAHDPFIARDMINRLDPDVVVLDIVMPGLDGLEFLERLMRLRPLPVVMFSALTKHGSEHALNALSIGAVDFVPKPGPEDDQGWRQVGAKLIGQIKAASEAQVQPAAFPAPRSSCSDPLKRNWPRNRIVGIGASTGGVQALRTLLAALPPDSPPILVVQHMPQSFMYAFAARLDANCRVDVAVATDGCDVRPGRVLVAPGGLHLHVEACGGQHRCRLQHGPEHNGHKPSVDVLFHSLAEVAGASALGIILTGMGRDGARGLRHMRDAGALTAAQDEATSLIYGMPKAAVELGGVQHELALDHMASFILSPQRAGISASLTDLAAVS